MDDESDLEAALALIARLRSERDEANGRSEQLRLRTLELQESNGSLRRELQTAQESRRAIENMHQQQSREWESQLRSCQQQLEHLQSETIPRSDMDLMRLKMLEEVRGQTEQQRQSLSDEATRFREAYYDAQNEIDRLKAAFDALTLDANRRDQRAQQQYDDMQRTLSDKIHLLQREIDSNIHAEEARRLRLEAGQWQLKLGSMQTELDAARREKMQAVSAQEQALQQVARLQSDLDAANTLLEAEAQSMSSQTDQLKRELEAAQDELARLREECSRIEHSKVGLRNALEGKIREQQQTINDMRLSHNQQMKQVEEERRALNARIEEAETRQAAAEAALAKAKASLHAATVEHCREMQAVREKEYARLREAEERCMTVEQQLHQTRAAHESATATAAREREHMMGELEQLKQAQEAEHREITRLRQDNQSLKHKAGQLEQLQEAHHDSQQQALRLQQDFDALRAKHEQLLREHERMSTLHAAQDREMQHLKGEDKELRESLSALEDKFTKLSDLAEAYKSKAKGQKQQLEEMVAAKDRQITELQESLDHWKKRCQGFESRVRHFGRSVLEETVLRGSELMRA